MAVFVIDKNKKPLMPCSEKRATGNFNIQTKSCLIQGISYKYCNIVSKADGYGYSTQPKIELTIGGSARAAV